jgi:hypothetical protein
MIASIAARISRKRPAALPTPCEAIITGSAPSFTPNVVTHRSVIGRPPGKRARGEG